MSTTPNHFAASLDYDRAILASTFVDVRQRLYVRAIAAMLASDAPSRSDMIAALASDMTRAAESLGIFRDADKVRDQRDAKTGKDKAARFVATVKAAEEIVKRASVAIRESGPAISMVLAKCNATDVESRAAHIMQEAPRNARWLTLDGAARMEVAARKAKQRAREAAREADGVTKEGEAAARGAKALCENIAHVATDDTNGVILAMCEQFGADAVLSVILPKLDTFTLRRAITEREAEQAANAAAESTAPAAPLAQAS